MDILKRELAPIPAEAWFAYAARPGEELRMTRILWTIAIVAIGALDVVSPSTDIGRRGSEASARSEAPSAWSGIGQPLPALALQHLDGTPFDLTSLTGHRVLLTFERSVDW